MGGLPRREPCIEQHLQYAKPNGEIVEMCLQIQLPDNLETIAPITTPKVQSALTSVASRSSQLSCLWAFQQWPSRRRTRKTFSQPKEEQKESMGQHYTRQAATIETRTASLSPVEQESIVPTRSSFARMNKPTLLSLCSVALE